MIIETVITKEQFLEVKKDYEQFIENIENFKSLDKLNELRREVHTYKGLFAQKEMLNIVKKLHNFETEIDNSLKNDVLSKNIKEVSKQLMYSWLELDLNIINKILGKDYLSKAEYVEIGKFRIDNIYNDLQNYKNNNEVDLLNKITKDVNDLKHKNIKIFFRPYEKLVTQLAIQLEKSINPLVMNIENIYIPDKYIPFINSLVHIFRNSVDHGIESADERYERDKEEFGTIQCDVRLNNNILSISIKDDGKGIDTKKIASLALKRGLYSENEIKELSQDDILMIIFKDAFTTNDKVTTISGRGVGLSSIITELNKLDGKIKIENNFTKGIEFKFYIPFL